MLKKQGKLIDKESEVQSGDSLAGDSLAGGGLAGDGLAGDGLAGDGLAKIIVSDLREARIAHAHLL